MYRVAIVGSGPAGFYAAEALLESGIAIQIDMLDRLPTPFGLVRGGVAPDHPKIKGVTAVFERIATNPSFTFYGNVTVGTSPTVEDLSQAYDGVMLACGAPRDCKLGIPGEELQGSHTATEFVGWYNGHPDFAHLEFDFSHPVAVVIGQGNVAADVARILLKPIHELETTDIAEHAVRSLRQSRVREVHIVGRRGPAQAKFSTAELRELIRLAQCSAVISAADLSLDHVSAEELSDPSNDNAAKNVNIFRALKSQPLHDRFCQFRFLETPATIHGKNRVQGIRLLKNELVGAAQARRAQPTDSYLDLPCGLVVQSIGNLGERMPGVPFDDRKGVIPSQQGRVCERDEVLPGLYVTGWLKRGANGVIGTNRADSAETVGCILDDLKSRAPKRKASTHLAERLRTAGTRITTYADWKIIDDLEVTIGKSRGKPREKFVRVDEMIRALDTRQFP